MRFLTNTYDPNRKDAKYMVARSFDESEEQAWQREKEWLAGKIIGEPQATPHYTVEQLKEMGLVGVYALDNGAETNV